MVENRETKVFTIKREGKDALEVELYTYATGKEANTIQNTYLQGATMSVEGGQQHVESIDPTIQEKVQDKMIVSLVVRVAESTENILDTVNNLPMREYNKIIEELDSMLSADKKK